MTEYETAMLTAIRSLGSNLDTIANEIRLSTLDDSIIKKQREYDRKVKRCRDVALKLGEMYYRQAKIQVSCGRNPASYEHRADYIELVSCVNDAVAEYNTILAEARDLVKHGVVDWEGCKG